MDPQEQTGTAPPTIHSMESWISHVLRVGVMIAGAITLVGIVLFMALGTRTGESLSVHQILHGGAPIPVTPDKILDGVDTGKPLEIIYLGMFVLILTPLARVAMTMVLFAAQKDWTFVLLTSIVLGVLILGLTGVVG
jgi:uncharacterized membrane protein